MKINCMHNVEPIEWTKLEFSGLAESSWVSIIWFSWVRLMHFNTYILYDIKAATISAVFSFLSNTKWHVKPIAADCSHIEPVPTNCHMKSEHTDCILREANAHWLHFTWSQYQLTAVTWIQYILTACHIKPVHADCILHEASTKWLQSQKAIT
jgi:hypothetical protein